MSPALTRRLVLKKGVFGGALLAIGAGGTLALRGGVSRSLPPEGLRAVGPQGYAVLCALAEHLIPRHPGFPTAEEIRVGFNSDRIIARVDPTARAELNQLLGLFENALANFLFGFRVTPFTAMSFDDQERVLAEWRDSRLLLRRTGMRALRAVVMAAYYGDRATWSAIHYPGPPTGVHDPAAPVWKGGDAPRPDGNGVWHDEDTP